MPASLQLHPHKQEGRTPAALTEAAACAAVAHVRSEGSGDWWRYDDSEVTRMATGPAGEHADHGVAADKRVTPPAELTSLFEAPTLCVVVLTDNRQVVPNGPTRACCRCESTCMHPIVQVKAGKVADGAAGSAAAAAEAAGPEAIEVIDLEAEAEPPAAVPATGKAAGARGGGGRGGGRQRAPKRKGGNAAAAANAAVTAAPAPNGLANGSAARVHDADGAAPMELADGEAGGAAAAADSITSANAYLLVYRRTSDKPSQPPPQLPARCILAALCCALK
jgi:hypothetical protein